MSKIAITVTRWGSCQYKITSSNPRARNSKFAAVSDPALAAAEAMNFAMAENNYCILAPQNVLEFIPAECRSK